MTKELIREKLIGFNATNITKWEYIRGSSIAIDYKECIIDCDDTYVIHVKHNHPEDMTDVIVEGICIRYHTNPLNDGTVHGIRNEFILM